MLANAAALLMPLVLTTGLDTAPPPSLHHEVRAHVTGYNTIPGQTDSTPCIAASGANICGRHDVVACPRRISLGTIVEIRGTTYVCEDRLAKKYDTRFDISCDKDKTCPYEVAGWVTIKVYDTPSDGHAVKEAASAKDAKPVAKEAKSAIRPVHTSLHLRHAARKLLASTVGSVAVLRGHS